MSTSPLGPFVGPPQVRQAVLATLATWAPFYVAEAIRQTGAELPGFTDFVNEPLDSPTTVEEAPRYIVAVPGTIGGSPPMRKGDGKYIATWDVQIALWLWGADYQETEDHLGYYVTAIRQLMLQQPSLGGFAMSTTWRAERYQEVATTAFRTLGQAIVQFAVQVDGVVDAFAGPASPPVDPTAPPPAAPAVTSTSVQVTKIL
jgi:hypothetical protein